VTAWSFVAALGLLLPPVAGAARLHDLAVRGDGCSDSLTILVILVVFVMFRGLRWRRPSQ
jgi:hypothetical protein